MRELFSDELLQYAYDTVSRVLESDMSPELRDRLTKSLQNLALCQRARLRMRSKHGRDSS